MKELAQSKRERERKRKLHRERTKKWMAKIIIRTAWRPEKEKNRYESSKGVMNVKILPSPFSLSLCFLTNEKELFSFYISNVSTRSHRLTKQISRKKLIKTYSSSWFYLTTNICWKSDQGKKLNVVRSSPRGRERELFCKVIPLDSLSSFVRIVLNFIERKL